MTIPTFFNPYQIFLRHHFVGFLLLICCVTANAAIAKSGLSESQQTWIKAHPVIQYAPEVDYGPFIYVNKQKKVDGLSVDFLKLLEQKTGLQFIPTDPLSLNDNLTKAKLHQVDMLTSLRPNPQRAEYLGFTQAYVSIPAILVLSKEEKNKKSLGDMAAMRVAVGKGYAVEAYVREKFP
ncbi:transporter substrate-binding domain-containing protein [Undibacterium sp. Xuan67W]|uniref:transporter substrate-binding domain-containing protein n=1 Tax=Undibacterium sp. Xuan67W TaxID=3413057 RepID=UPI003BF2DB05